MPIGSVGSPGVSSQVEMAAVLMKQAIDMQAVAVNQMLAQLPDAPQPSHLGQGIDVRA